mgnify:CR=1 FL=1
MAAEDDDSADFSDYDERENFDQFDGEQVDGQGEEDELVFKEVFDARIMPGDNEKLGLLTSFQSMREEGTFCDVAFLCKGTLFKAHRVVVSAWSRWLAALLGEGSSEEVVHLDLFEPESFKAVLDYMYGLPFYVNIDTIETLMKVVRRLELHGLEKSCWILLMKLLDKDNAAQLHELADRYDCPPMKLAAWRMLQEQLLGPMSKHIDADASDFQKGTGLTGPGEAEFLHNITAQDVKDKEMMANDTTELPQVQDLADDDDDEGEEEGKELDLPLPEQLDKHASAEDVVKAWALRLNDVYNDCATEDMSGFDFAPDAFSPSTTTGSGGGGGGSGSPGGLTRSGKNVKQVLRKIRNGRGIIGREVRPARGGKDALTRNALHDQMRGKKKLGVADIDWKAELKGFYLGINMPEKLPYLDDILEYNKGKEEQMISYLIVKYKRVIPDNLATHLDTLQGFIETNTESSFDQR